MDALKDLAALNLQRIWDGVHGRVLHGERITLAVIELDPNGVVPEHSHENEQLGMCLGGSLAFRVGDESRELGPGGTWTIPGGVAHEVQAGRDGAIVIDVFVPPREDWREAEFVDPRPPRWPG